ncbi:MAG: hypothetical protein ACRCT8_13090 [Lacipirellulaceae bacterium]
MLCFGCSPSPYELAPAGGVVTVGGEPYPGGKVMFAPVAQGEDGKAGRAAFGKVGADGRFVLSSYAEGDGAVVGQHVVTLFRMEPPSADGLEGLDFERVTMPSGRVTIEADVANEIAVKFTLDELKKYGNVK